MRSSQWRFLGVETTEGKYYLARVSLKPKLEIKYLKIDLKLELNK